MERFNPFSGSSLTEHDGDPFTTSFNRSSPQRQAPVARAASTAASLSSADSPPFGAAPINNATNLSSARYTTSFPDPFKDQLDDGFDSGNNTSEQREESAPRAEPATKARAERVRLAGTSNRTSSVTFAPSSHSVDIPAMAAEPPPLRSGGSIRRPHGGAERSSGFSSFLSRATSVTSSAMTERVSEAVGSVRSAVDSISSQIQAVPANLNERISSTASNLMGSSAQPATDSQEQGGQQQSATGYLARISSINASTQESTPNSALQQAVISRQRVVLILDSFANTDWAQHFNQYYKLTSLASGSSASSSVGLAQSALTSFFSSATAQLSSISGSSNSTEGADLIEQADFRDVSVLANQSSSTAVVHISGSSAISGGASKASLTTSPSFRRTPSKGKIIRPEYVVVRQRSKDNQQHLQGIVSALNYCLVPMFEPIEVWNIFQDRQMIFSKLLKVQKLLGRENFPLVPQVFCQTHQDLLNYINSQSSIVLPCLICTGPLGKGKLRIENLQTLKEFSSIMATNGLSCTIEQCLTVKSDLIIQKLGTSLKLFRRNLSNAPRGTSTSTSTSDCPITSTSTTATTSPSTTAPQPSSPNDPDKQADSRQSASRQTSLGAGVLTSFIQSSSSALSQQQARRSSAGAQFEKLSDVNARYKTWINAIQRELKIEAFCVKVAITTDDREYVVGLSDCSMNFMGNQENQDEDRRSFVELVISNMNTILPKNHTASQVSPTAATTATTTMTNSSFRRTSSSDRVLSGSPTAPDYMTKPPLADKKKFISQTQINGAHHEGASDSLGGQHRNYGQLSSRSQSVSVNQSEFMAEQALMNKSSYFSRRGSDRSDSLTANESVASFEPDLQGSQSLASNSDGLHQRQASLGQSFFDSTSTALSSIQKQSLSFFKRLDAVRAPGDFVIGTSNTPPQSAKSDKNFDRAYTNLASKPTNIESLAGGVAAGGSANGRSGGFKSQSMDSSALERTSSARGRKRDAPPKPPPPQTMSYRQSSLAAYSMQRQHAAPSAGGSTSSTSALSSATTPMQSRQNSNTSSSNNDGTQTRGKVVRQNSALSAFEPFDPDIACRVRANEESLAESSGGKVESHTNRSVEQTKRGANFDSASITSGDSYSTGETNTAEDTMNNLKKTFASIFGDKCE